MGYVNTHTPGPLFFAHLINNALAVKGLFPLNTNGVLSSFSMFEYQTELFLLNFCLSGGLLTTPWSVQMCQLGFHLYGNSFLLFEYRVHGFILRTKKTKEKSNKIFIHFIFLVFYLICLVFTLLSSNQIFDWIWIVLNSWFINQHLPREKWLTKLNQIRNAQDPNMIDIHVELARRLIF